MGEAQEHERDRRLALPLIVRVLYFASARDLASTGAENVPLPEGAHIHALESEILKLHPGLRPLRKSIRFSVNFKVVDDGTPIRDGDEVGVLPPVAGG